jgi:hypothetical protein
LWICLSGTGLTTLTDLTARQRNGRRLLALGPLGSARRQLLEGLFRRVIAAEPGLSLLPDDELIEVISSPSRQDLLLGAATDREARAIVVLRGNLEPVVVPFAWFRSPRGGPVPDFANPEIVDGGQTIRLGPYEAATDALLFEIDREYRSRSKSHALEQDDSFGGALKRLRLLRGLTRSDFSGISAKSVARIERGEVSRPHDRTLRLLATRLGVHPEEIETF